MNIMPDVLYGLTIAQITRYYRGFQIRQSYDWAKFRYVAWFGSLPYQDKRKRLDQYDMMKLLTDPTEEEIKEMKLEAEAEQREQAKQIFEYYRQQGYNV